MNKSIFVPLFVAIVAVAMIMAATTVMTLEDADAKNKKKSPVKAKPGNYGLCIKDLGTSCPLLPPGQVVSCKCKGTEEVN